MPERNKPWKICRVGGREFQIYQEYDDEVKESYPAYPDFAECPEYTDDGFSFATAEHEGCPHYKPHDPEGPGTDDCGGCLWFRRDETPFDIIGVCTCDTLRRKPNEKNADNPDRIQT